MFGHYGDGASSFQYGSGSPARSELVFTVEKDIHAFVYESYRHGTTTSAEHGIGQLKREDPRMAKDPRH